MKMVLCVWEDAVVLDGASVWVARDNLKPNKPTHFHHVGFLFEVTEDAIVLTEAIGEDEMAPRTRIPRGMVRKLVELKEGKAVPLPRKVKR